MVTRTGTYSAVCLLVSFLLAISCLTAPAAAQDNEDEIRTEFKKAVDFYETGEYGKCGKALNKVLELQPTSNLALELRNLTGYSFFMKLLAKKPLDQMARDFLKIAEKAVVARNRDETYITELIEGLRSKDFYTQWEKKMRLEAEVGQFAIPQLVKKIQTEKGDFPVMCRLVLKGIEEEGVPGLLATIDSGDKVLVETMTLLLGQIKDGRAVPDLVAIYQNPKSTKEVKDLATEAIKAITGKDVNSMSPAKELFFDLAEQYYYRHPSIMKENRATGYILWGWSEEKDGLVWQEAPPSVYYNELAEHACYDCLALDPSFEPAYSLLAAVYFSQLGGTEAILKAAEAGDDENSDIIERTLSYLKQRTDDLKKKTSLVTKTSGPVFLYRCLDRTLKDGNVPVSVMAMRMLAQIGDGSLLPVGGKGEVPEEGLVGGAEGTSLIRALNSPDEIIRYVAANTIVDMEPKTAFMHSERVVPVLSQALGEKAVWFAVVADPDLARLNKLKALFPAEQFKLTAVTTAANVRHRALDFPTPDVILLSSSLKAGAQQLVQQLKADYRSKNIPVYVMSTQATLEADRNAFKDKVDGVLVLKDNIPLTIDMIAREFGKRWQGSVKSEAEGVALRAAESLAQIKVLSTVLTPNDALNILIKSAAERTDEIKKPCIKALGNLGRPEASSVLSDLFENRQNVLEIRFLSGAALMYCDPKKGYDVCRRALNESEEGVREWAASALGRSGLRGKELLKIVIDQRIGPPVGDTESKGPGAILVRLADEKEAIVADPRSVVEAYIEAVLASKFEDMVDLMDKESRDKMRAAKSSDAAAYKQMMSAIVRTQSEALRDASIGDIIEKEGTAKATVKKGGIKTTFILVKEDKAWRVQKVE